MPSSLVLLPVLTLTVADPDPTEAAPLSPPLEWLQQCLKEAPRATAVDSCAGRWSGLCQDQPDSGTTLGIASCLMQEQQAWDSLLAKLNDQLEATATLADTDQPDGPSLAAALTAAKGAWEGFRAAQCDYEYTEYAGGSMRSIARASCSLTLTADRYAYLLEHSQQK